MKESLTEEYLWYLENSRHRTPNTLESYQNDLRQYCDFVSSCAEISYPRGTSGVSVLSEVDLSTQITQATSETAADFCEFLKSKFYAPTTIARKCAAVEGFYKHLSRNGRVAENPFCNVHFVKPKHAGRICIEDSHVLQLLNAIPGDDWLGLRDRAIVVLLYTAGIKVGELSHLSPMDYSADEKTLSICKLGRKTRIAFLPEQAAIILQDYLSARRQKIEEATPAREILFLNRDCGPLTVRSIRRKLKLYSRDAGLSFIVTPEMLRRSHAVKMLRQGVGLEELARQLGYFSVMALKQQMELNEIPDQPQ
jgi:site-specific recombinase XerD